MTIGTDIVYIPRFAQRMRTEGFLEKAFTLEELESKEPEHLAGVLAAKEAYFKALGIIPPRFLDVEVSYLESGQPVIISDKNVSVSISHDGDYAVAVVLSEE